MGQKLDRLISSFAEGYKDRSSDANVYAAAKRLESEIVQEICEEQAERIANNAERIRANESARAALREAKTVVLQCVGFALLVGLLSNHVYSLLQVVIYQGAEGLNVGNMLGGTAVLLILCVACVGWFMISRVSEVIDVFKAATSKGND
ncbi:hypothetical protein [Adlercreutzia sp. ZJ141]|uniref:hypothetical protein n=1 Tax=Adlercreutzia sp. ZJ141 TaxID=2709406 RepID=UPI0013E9A8B0|nr:hypothetical protein [Adlercreutzia sp. ZJ141]